MSIISETKNELMLPLKNDTTKNYPKCGTLLHYSNKYDCRKSIRKNSPCRECVTEEHRASGRYCGAKNPFYGRRHTEKTRSMMSAVDRSWMTGSENPMKNEDTKKYFSELFTGHGPMSGKHHTDAAKKKLSIANSGKNNPMYGKPTPNGAGNGWANWYKGRHFRSLRELQYYVSEIDTHNILCESAQQKRFRIPYKDYNGVDRTYRPDFFVDNHLLIEIKPKKLWNTKEVVAKKNAAEEFCRKMGYEYKLVDVEPNSLCLKEKYLNGEIKFVDKYKLRFEKYIGIKNI